MSAGPFDSSHHIHEEALELYMHQRLGVSESEALEQHLLDCNECKQRLDKTVHFTAKTLVLQRVEAEPNQRAEPRFSSNDCGFLRSLSPLLPDRWPVRIVDVSRKGLGLVIPVRLAPGTMVQVRVGKTVALGDVVYSTRLSEHEFRVGLCLEDVSWSSE